MLSIIVCPSFTGVAVVTSGGLPGGGAPHFGWADREILAKALRNVGVGESNGSKRIRECATLTKFSLATDFYPPPNVDILPLFRNHGYVTASFRLKQILKTTFLTKQVFLAE